MQDAKILDLDATAVLEAYRNGRLTPGRAVEAYIAHQQRVNPALNLVVAERYAEARAEAARCDELLKRGDMAGALFGVPMSMKESLDVAGLPTTGGLTALKGRMASSDADTVGRLRRAGAVIMDKTNTPALCFCQETDNLLFGRSNNPWDPARTTGGSSGGEAALIAVGGAAAGFGSDIGGSIRIPSHFNGVVGFKPGARRSSQKGHLPEVAEADQLFMLGLGPIVKSVRDAALLYSIIQPDFAPPASWDPPPDARALSFGSFGKVRCSADTEHILAQAQGALSRAGLGLKQGAPDFMEQVSPAWQMAMAEGKGRGICELAYPDNPRGFWLDWLKYKLGLKALNHRYLSWAAIGANLFAPNDKQVQWLREVRRTGLEKLEELLGERGVLLTPVYPTPAKAHGRVYKEIFSARKTFDRVLPFIALANLLGLPALVVPCGRSARGLPIGLQVTAALGSEQLIFQVGAVLEKALGGWRRCADHD